jgi:ribosome-associated translation inhibitor RaiA
MMKVNIHTEGVQLTSRLRELVEFRLWSALRPFREHVASAVMNLRGRLDRSQPATAGCDVVVTLHPSGEVRAGAQDARLEEAIDRAIEGIREAVKYAVSQPVVRTPIGHGALEIVLDGNRISQHHREMLERPENYLRPVIVREYWRPSEVEHDEPTEKRDAALAIAR